MSVSPVSSTMGMMKAESLYLTGILVAYVSAAWEGQMLRCRSGSGVVGWEGGGYNQDCLDFPASSAEHLCCL